MNSFLLGLRQHILRHTPFSCRSYTRHAGWNPGSRYLVIPISGDLGIAITQPTPECIAEHVVCLSRYLLPEEAIMAYFTKDDMFSETELVLTELFLRYFQLCVLAQLRRVHPHTRLRPVLCRAKRIPPLVQLCFYGLSSAEAGFIQDTVYKT